LGGRGRLGHGETLYDDIVRVPLLVKLPGNARAGTRVPWQVRAVDVAPTIVEAAGLAPPEAWRGATVFDDWFEDDLALLVPPVPEPDEVAGPFTPPAWPEHPGSRPALVELSTPNGGLVAVREGGLKLVRRTGSVVPGSACYDLRAEPGEVRALPPDDARCRRADIADALLGGWTGVRPPPTPAEDPPAEVEEPLVVAPDEEE
ncbi:MAG: sulfatase/phosphatase domain-containing protein, partial [Myxococcota bacterium]